MKLITRNTDYAAKALTYMARHNQRTISVAELVKELKIPRAFLRKILQLLNKAGLVISTKGVGGGFKLALPAEKIFLVDLVEILQGPLDLSDCLFKKKLCPDRDICVLKKKVEAIEGEVIEKLKSITLASLSNEE